MREIRNHQSDFHNNTNAHLQRPQEFLWVALERSHSAAAVFTWVSFFRKPVSGAPCKPRRCSAHTQALLRVWSIGGSECGCIVLRHPGGPFATGRPSVLGLFYDAIFSFDVSGKLTGGFSCAHALPLCRCVFVTTLLFRKRERTTVTTHQQRALAKMSELSAKSLTAVCREQRVMRFRFWPCFLQIKTRTKATHLPHPPIRTTLS